MAQVELAVQPLLEIAKAKLSRTASPSAGRSPVRADALSQAYIELREMRMLLFRAPIAVALREAEVAVAEGRMRASTVWHQMFARSPAALLSPYRTSYSSQHRNTSSSKGKAKSLVLYTSHLDALEMKALAASLKEEMKSRGRERTISRGVVSLFSAEDMESAAARDEDTLEFRVAALMLATNAAMSASARGVEEALPFSSLSSSPSARAFSRHWLPVEEACWERVRDCLDNFAKRITVMKDEAEREDEARALYDTFRDGGRRLMAAMRRACGGGRGIAKARKAIEGRR